MRTLGKIIVSLVVLLVVAVFIYLFFTYGPVYLLGPYTETIAWICGILVAVAAVTIATSFLRRTIMWSYLADLLILAVWFVAIQCFFVYGPSEIFASYENLVHWICLIILSAAMLVTIVRWIIHANRLHTRKGSSEEGANPYPNAAKGDYSLSVAAPTVTKTTAEAAGEEACVADVSDMKAVPDTGAAGPVEDVDTVDTPTADAAETIGASEAPAIAVTATAAAPGCSVSRTSEGDWSAWDAWDFSSDQVAASISEISSEKIIDDGALLSEGGPSAALLIDRLDDDRLRRLVVGSFADDGYCIRKLKDPKHIDRTVMIAEREDESVLIVCLSRLENLNEETVDRLYNECESLDCNGAVIVVMGSISGGAMNCAAKRNITLWGRPDLSEFL